MVVVLAGFVGCALGAIALGFAAMWIGMSLLSQARGGIHSDWTMVVLFGALLGLGLGGFAGAKAAVGLAKAWRG